MRKQIENFFKYNTKNPIGANAVALYMLIVNRADAEGKLEMSDYESAKLLKLARQTVITTRKKLQQLKFIECKANRCFPTKYQILGVENKEQISFEKHKNIPKVSKILEPPTLEKFLEFAKTWEHYDDSYEKYVIVQYKEWAEKGWKTKMGRVITNWKMALKNAMPFLKRMYEFN